MVETRFLFSSLSAAVSGSVLCHTDTPDPKLRPPDSGCTSLVYTRMASPGLNVIEEKVGESEGRATVEKVNQLPSHQLLSSVPQVDDLNVLVGLALRNQAIEEDTRYLNVGY